MRGTRQGTWGLVLLAAVLLAACGGSGSGSGSSVAEPEIVTGLVVQGPVSGALVIADLDADRGTVSGANRSLDTDEVSTHTDSVGDFDLSIPVGYGAYTLVSLGGMDSLSGHPAMPMLAPSGAKNITPLTTLVASVPEAEREELIATLDSLAGAGGSYDDDPAGGVPAEFLALTKIVEQTVSLFESLGVNEVTDQLELAGAIAATINVDPEAEPVDAPAIGTAVTTTLKTLETQLTVADAADAADAAATVAELINTVTRAVDDMAVVDGKVVEDEAIATTLTEETATAVTKVEEYVGFVRLSVASVAFTDSAEDPVVFTDGTTDIDTFNDEYENLSILAQDFNTATSLELSISASNTTEVEYTGADVTLTLAIDDRASFRSITFTLSGLQLSIATDGTLNITIDAAAELRVVGVDGAGNQVSLNDGLAAAEFMTVDGESLQIDWAALQTELGDLAVPFETINWVGDYSLVFSASGAPLVPGGIDIEVLE